MADDKGAFRSDVLAGLALPQKTIPSQYFYDERGSELFEEITHLPEYYPTRTELQLLSDSASSIADVIGPSASIVEYGAGAMRKIRLLLPVLDAPKAYIPVDVSGPFLQKAAQELRLEHNELLIHPVISSFLAPDLKIEHPVTARSHIGFFPGSTLGNLDDNVIVEFLKAVRAHLTLSPGFLIGVDINQDPATLIPAYNDAAGVTAAFNRNLLARMNRELGADFDVDAFVHEARWNAGVHQIEMHLISTKNQTVTIAGEAFSFKAGETIHTENSRKFTPDMLRGLAAQSGWRVKTRWVAVTQTMALFWLVPK